MKCLTVWQPWASMIVLGIKPYEFRGWAAPKWVQGQRIGIHAGARLTRRTEVDELLDGLRMEKAGMGLPTTLQVDAAIAFLEEVIVGHCMGLPTSAVIGTSTIGRPVLAKDLAELRADSDRVDHTKWAWPMLDVQRALPPRPATGAQGFWNWRGEL
jgi:hypothetical protein